MSVCLIGRAGRLGKKTWEILGYGFQDMVFRTWDLNFGASIFTLAVSKIETWKLLGRDFQNVGSQFWDLDFTQGVSQWPSAMGTHLVRASVRLWPLDTKKSDGKKKSDDGRKEKWREKDKTTVGWRAFEVLKPWSWELRPKTSLWGPETQVLRAKSWNLALRSWNPGPKSVRALLIGWSN